MSESHEHEHVAKTLPYEGHTRTAYHTLSAENERHADGKNCRGSIRAINRTRVDIEYRTLIYPHEQKHLQFPP